MEILINFLLLMIIVSCDQINIDANIYENKLGDYKCTQEQLNLVNKEVTICNRTTIFSSVCFAQAKKTQCDKIEKVKE